MPDPQQLQQQLNQINQQFDLLEDKLGNIGALLTDKLKNRISDLKDEARDFVDRFEKGEDVTKKLSTKLLSVQKDINKLSLNRVKLENDLSRAQANGNVQAETSIKKAINGNKLATSLLESLQTQLITLQKTAVEEKKITEEKKKQNSLAEVLKKKFSDQLKTLKEIFTLGSIVDMLFKGSENIANFRKELGISYSSAYALNNQMGFVGNNVFDAYINGEKLKKSFTDLSKEMGFIVDYGNESLVTMTNLTGRLGMSNKEAAQLTTLSRMQSKNTEGVLNNVGKTVSAMNKQGKTAILLKDVMKDIGNVSKAVAVSLGSNPVKIAEAVVAAKQLGTTLEQMESTADALLNFETSIEDELKAELLTGKQMNLERARAAALANDMKTLSEEIGKNEEVINAFASNNRLAQEATAKALGMNREQLAGIVYQQEAQRTSAEAVRAKYGEQAYEQLKAQSAQEKFNNSIDKLKSALSSIVQIFSPIIDAVAAVSEFVSSIVSQWYILYPLIGLVALNYLPKLVGGFANIGKSIANIGSNFTKLFSKEGRASLMGGADKVKETAEGAAGAGGKAGKGGPKAGDGIKNTLKGISAGIASFKEVSPADIGKLALSSLALTLLTPAIPALLLLQLVNGKLIQGALTGIGKGLAAMGKAMAAAAPEILIGELLLAGLGLSLMAFVPIVKAIGEVISNVITSVATGISVIVDSVGTLISKLGEAAPALLLLGPALFGIAAGLSAMGFSGLLALPTIFALTSLGEVAPALSSIGIGGGDKEDTNAGIDFTPMIAAINEVKASVDKLYSKDTSVNMDGKKVGTTLTQGSYKVA